MYLLLRISYLSQLLYKSLFSIVYSEHPPKRCFMRPILNLPAVLNILINNICWFRLHLHISRFVTRILLYCYIISEEMFTSDWCLWDNGTLCEQLRPEELFLAIVPPVASLATLSGNCSQSQIAMAYNETDLPVVHSDLRGQTAGGGCVGSARADNKELYVRSVWVSCKSF